MRKLTIAVCVIAVGILMIQGPLCAKGGGAAHAGGGAFGGGGFNGGSIGSAGHVNNHPNYGRGSYGYGYAMGPTSFEGDGDLGGSSGGSAPVAYGGTGGGPPDQPQDGTGVYKPRGSGDPDGPSWDSDWWAHDPEPDAGKTPELDAGATLPSLPKGYDTVYLSSQPYYYNDGTYFESTDSGYAVVSAPVGITVTSLPNQAELITVDRQQLFQVGDAYYQALYSGNGLVYKVVEDPGAAN